MKIRLIAASLALISGTALAGTITNGDFSTGNLSGWNATSNVSVVSNGSGYAADLSAGLGANVYTTLSQNIYLAAGDTLSGWAQWLGHDYLPFNDNGFVSIGGTNLFTGSIASYGDFGSSPEIDFNFTAATSGFYTLSAGVENDLDNGLASELKVGGFAVTNKVPEPASLALLGLGLAGLVASRRRKTA